ncbi:MAG TPA: hypothetical protein VNA69_02315 [Thermoanaerobaculia bacterium]|nr:hypothetical protein [Thermoanaerobaculia bacterium]
MPLIVRAFPLRRDRSEAEAFAGELRRRADDARRFYTSFGVRRESWFFQGEPFGPLVIGVTDADDRIESNAARYAATDEAFASWFKERVQTLSGVDQTKEPLGPPAALVFESSRAELPRGIAISARIYPVKNREDLLRFADELRLRAAKTRAFYESFNVPREVWYLQETERGPVVIGVTAMEAPEKAKDYAETDEPFAVWFKQRVIDVTGIDPNVTPLGPPSELIYEFQT